MAKSLLINTLSAGIILIVLDESEKKVILRLFILFMRSFQAELSVKRAGPDKFLKARIALAQEKITYVIHICHGE